MRSSRRPKPPKEPCMKLSALVCVAAVALLSAPHAHARKGAGRERRPRAVTWKVDNLKKIGGNRVAVIGAPRVTKAPKGKAVLFDGARDGLLLEVNPVAGARAFTIEAVIRPDAGGP